MPDEERTQIIDAVCFLQADCNIKIITAGHLIPAAVSIVKGDGLLQISATSETIGVIYHDSDYVDDVTWDFVKVYTSTTGNTFTLKMANKSFGVHVLHNSLSRSNPALQLLIPENYKLSDLSLSIYTVNGKMVRTFSREQLAGRNIIPVKGSSDGTLLSAGMYFCVLKAGKIRMQVPLVVW